MRTCTAAAVLAVQQIFRILHSATVATRVLDSELEWDVRKGEGGGRVKAPGTLSSARQIQEIWRGRSFPECRILGLVSQGFVLAAMELFLSGGGEDFSRRSP